jgi:hypothetical protein
MPGFLRSHGYEGAVLTGLVATGVKAEQTHSPYPLIYVRIDDGLGSNNRRAAVFSKRSAPHRKFLRYEIAYGIARVGSHRIGLIEVR